MITLDASGNPTQQTVCRPIGLVPNTTAKSYVMIPSDHIKSYTSNVENPYTIASLASMAKARDAYYTTHGLYKDKDGTLVYKGEPIADVWKDAARKREMAIKAAKAAHIAKEASEGRFPPGTPGNPGKGAKEKTARAYTATLPSVNEYLPGDFKAEFEIMDKQWKSSVTYHETEQACKAILAQFETRGGPDGTTPQKVLTWLEGVPHNQVKMYLNRIQTDPAGTLAEIKGRYPLI